MSLSLRSGVCGWLVRFAKSLPVVFIISVVCWSYYAYLVQLSVKTVLTEDGPVVAAVLLVLYHFFLFMFLWSYYQVVMTPAGKVPSSFKLSSAELDSIETARDPKAALERIVLEKEIPVYMRSFQGEVRYCSECSQIKPDRCHHCSVCGECILKMDHHCPWVNNCVAFQNYKFFILFLGYALAYCLYVAFSSLKYFLQFWTRDLASQYGKFHVLFLFFVSAMFALSVTSLFSYHLYLISRNRTTLEAFRTPIFRGSTTPDPKAFHLGIYNNFQEVFGDRILLWFVPLATSLGDGVVFPQRGHLSDIDEEAGLLRRMDYRNELGTEESMPMIGGLNDDDDEDDEEEEDWSKVDVKDAALLRKDEGHVGIL